MITITDHTHSVAIALPEDIASLPPEIWSSDAFLISILIYDELAIKVAIFNHLYPQYSSLPAHQLSFILSNWSLQMKHSATCPNPNLSPYLLTKAAWPSIDFGNGTLREFIYMDEYLESGDITSLVALLCRPIDYTTTHVRDDQRTQLYAREQIRRYADTIHRHSSSRWMTKRVLQSKAIALSLSIGIKQLIAELYSTTLFRESVDNESPRHNLGWISVAMQVAESKVFGTYEQVLDTTLHEVCAFLVTKKLENDRVQNQMNSNL